MPRPETIIRVSLKRAPFFKRVRRRLTRTWAAYTLARRKVRYRRSLGAPSTKTTAFIFGCQRSGTNMTLYTLNRSLDVDSFEESDPRAFTLSRILGKDVRDRLIAQSSARCVIFKPICDSHRVLELLAEHPGSRGIWIYRYYKDVANSAMEYWGDQTRLFIEDLLEGGGDWGRSQWNREKVTDECLAELREACIDGLTPHGACALFWYMRNRTFFDQDLEHTPDVLITRYEDVVTKPEEEFGRMCEFLGVGFDPQAVSKVFKSSVGKRKFPPVGERVEALCEAMWERLNAVRDAVADGSGTKRLSACSASH